MVRSYEKKAPILVLAGNLELLFLAICHLFVYLITNIYFSSNSHGVATNPLNLNTEEIARKYTKQVLLLYLLSMCVVRTTIPNSKVIVV